MRSKESRTIERGGDGILGEPENVQVLQAGQPSQLLNVGNVVLAKEELPERDSLNAEKKQQQKNKQNNANYLSEAHAANGCSEVMLFRDSEITWNTGQPRILSANKYAYLHVCKRADGGHVIDALCPPADHVEYTLLWRGRMLIRLGMLGDAAGGRRVWEWGLTSSGF